MGAHLQITKWFEHRTQINRESVCFLLVHARHLVEESGKRNYPVLTFWTDLLVHSSLDRSHRGREVLMGIEELLAANLNPTSPMLGAEISELIAIPKLRAELLALFQAYKLPSILFEYYENWKAFGMFLLDQVAEKSVTLGNIRGGRGETSAPPLSVVGVRIELRDKTFWWTLTVLADETPILVTGKLDALETADKFIPPA